MLFLTVSKLSKKILFFLMFHFVHLALTVQHSYLIKFAQIDTIILRAISSWDPKKAAVVDKSSLLKGTML